ncbi:Predicted metal-dependent hydrolase, TIM-barrel fold [Formivibrio citricus]|uniref:Predicted metal-dependent hydrolase, TIM-barrel fold n=1 Tax=Formivibrio citricus TaxID=83765 RepID=A0A1I5CJY6_9NEIS|nr:amidohydrolase family protein [Formivibrio citricus]SFN87309.1 Predicted metal-dependent hydrolase, TIM-barrel fold [Formivibrio citricus]
MSERIDAWTHIFPPAFFARLQTMASATGPLRRWLELKSLYDLDHRFRLMDGFEGYKQLLTPSMPPIEELVEGAQAIDLTRLMNDGLAELVDRHPDRFPGFAAALPMHNIEAAVDEIARVDAMGAAGVQLPSHIRGIPLDHARFIPVFDEIARRRLAIWLHPVRGPVPDYPTEEKSRYEIWWCFGWPYESSVAMARLVFSGLFDRHPDLKIITHHMGAMIPYFAGRIEQGWGLEMGSRTPPADANLLPGKLNRSVEDYFRMFYADTALSGAEGATRCGLEYFGEGKVLFASDFPFDAEGGSYLVRETIKALDNLGLADPVRRRIDSENILAIIRRDTTRHGPVAPA